MHEELSLTTLMKDPTIEFLHNFIGCGIHKNSKCNVKIWIFKDKVFVLFTDLGQGTSVTNAAEQLATEVYNLKLKRDFPKENCFFAETYQDKDGIDLIIPEWVGDKAVDADWRHFGVLVGDKKEKRKKV